MKKRHKVLTSRPAMALLGGLLLALASQANISIFQSDFRISAAVMLLPMFVYLVRDFPVFPTALAGGAGTVLLRMAVEAMQQGSFAGTFAAYAPEFLFFVAYGALFSLYLRFVELRPFRWHLMLPVAAIDFLSNLFELGVRLGEGVFSARVLMGILAAAVCRTLITAVFLWVLDAYGVALLRREDSERYRRLLLMTASLEGELAFLRRNADLIEGIMRNAYSLYDNLSADAAHAESAQKALGVAKDIHEVKKEYLLIVRGIGETLEAEAADDGMYFSEIWSVLRPGLLRMAREAGKQVELWLGPGEDFYTPHHYALMSILRNLLGNAVEAAGAEPAEITLQAAGKDPVRITVRDNCGGILPKNLDKVFRPGFSTKLDGATGEVGRGLGLALVKDLVENLGGRVTVESDGKGTCFTVEIPWERLVEP